MTISRYVNRDGVDMSIANDIYRAVLNNEIGFKTMTTSAGDRLDRIAFKEYNDAQLWWVIAAASGIGWWLQVQEDIVLNIPTNIKDIENIRGGS